MTLPSLRSTLIAFSILTFPAALLNAQQDPLFQKVASLDTALFDAANRCDLEKLGAMVTDDLEFYHDQSGLSIGKQDFLNKIKNNTCGKMIRELVPGSMEVYPLKGFGAVEIASHRFHHPGHDDVQPVGQAKFIHVWQEKDGVWRLSRVISYDHGQAGSMR